MAVNRTRVPSSSKATQQPCPIWFNFQKISNAAIAPSVSSDKLLNGAKTTCFGAALTLILFHVQSIGKPVRDTAKTLRDVVDATRFIRDTVANIATNAARTRTAAGMASASIWRPPPTQRSNASARWDGLDRNAINNRR